jgi:hypothetical protein
LAICADNGVKIRGGYGINKKTVNNTGYIIGFYPVTDSAKRLQSEQSGKIAKTDSSNYG